MIKKPMLMQKKTTAVLMITVTVLAAAGIIYSLFPLEYEGFIKKYSDKFGIDRYITAALIKAESSFDSEAVSRADAYGIMQLTRQTFAYCMESLDMENNSDDIFDTEKNIMAGTWYMAKMLEKYNGDITCSAAAYNAGASNVDKWLKNSKYSHDGKTLFHIPFGETQRHVKKIRLYTRIYRVLYPGFNK